MKKQFLIAALLILPQLCFSKGGGDKLFWIRFNAEEPLTSRTAPEYCVAVCVANGRNWVLGSFRNEANDSSACGCITAIGPGLWWPFQTDSQAQFDCPHICSSHGERWNGQWHTIANGLTFCGITG